MNIIIAGAGEVGRHAAEVFVEQGHKITMIDVSAPALANVEEVVDARLLQGSCTHAEILREAGIDKCDFFIAATQQDELNLFSAHLCKRMGAFRVVARIHHRAYLDRSIFDYAKNLYIDHLICPEYLTAQVIARSLRNPGVMAIERFAQEKIEMRQYVVEEGSQATGIPLRELPLPAGVRLATVERGEQAFIPHRATVLDPGDKVAIIGETEKLLNVRHLFHPGAKSKYDIIIMGGTSTAVWISRALKSRLFSIRLFETDMHRAEELSDKLNHVTVIQSDPTDPNVFAEEHVGSAHAFIAVSASDEHNLLAALQAKQFGVKRTAVIIQQSAYLPLLTHLGIDLPYSPRVVAARELLRLVDRSSVRRLATLAPQVAEVYELDPANAGSAVGAVLRDITLPESSFVAAVQRGVKVHVPLADDHIEKGDMLIVIGPTGIEKQLQSLFIGK